MTTMNNLFDSTMYFGGNAPFVEELYENYLNNPTAVPEEWREYFDRLAQMPGFVARDVAHAPVISAFAELAKDGGFRPAPVAGGDNRKQSAVGQLVTAYRSIGTRWADLDPLKRLPRPKIDELEPSFYGFTDADLNQSFSVGSLKGLPESAQLGDILETLKQTYCGTVGVEYMYMSDYNEKRWLQERLESIRSRPTYNADQKKRLLERLTAAETLERYLHTKYVGQKRFSLEGGESLIVSMDEAIRTGGAMGVDEVVIGMAHRGRLNVLVNTLGKAPSMLFAEFEGKKKSDLSAGDVKYHMGFSSDVSTRSSKARSMRDRFVVVKKVNPRCCRLLCTATRLSPGRALIRKCSTLPRPVVMAQAVRYTSWLTTRSALRRVIRVTTAPVTTVPTFSRWQMPRSSMSMVTIRKLSRW